MMSRRLLSVAAVALFMTAGPGILRAADSEPVLTVEAAGLGSLRPDQMGASREEAIRDAKRNAVDQAGSLVVSQTLVEDFTLVKDRIITRAEGYINRYDVLEEGPREKDYRVRIRAEVNRSPLEQDALLIYHEMDKPRLMVVVNRALQGEFVPAQQAENAVSALFLEKGFELVDSTVALENVKKDELRKIAEGDTAAAAKVGLRSGAEAIVTGTALFGNAESVRGQLYGNKATITLRVVRTDNAGILAAVTVDKPGAEATPEAASRKALEAASAAAAREVFAKVVHRWNQEQSVGRPVEILVSGVAFGQLKGIRSLLERTYGVSEVVQRSFDTPTATFQVNYRGDSVSLAEILAAGGDQGIALEVLTVTPGKLSLRVK